MRNVRGSWRALWRIVVPVWTVLAAGRVAYHALLYRDYPHYTPPPSSMALLTVLLTPLVLLGCLIAAKTWTKKGSVVAIAVAVVTAFAVGASALPLYVVAAWLDPFGPQFDAVTVAMAKRQLGEWKLWLAAVAAYGPLYLACVAGVVAFLSYRDLYRERLRRARSEVAVARERLRALRAQLSPHFLFNALTAISGLEVTRPGASHELVAKLSRLLRQTLEASDKDTHSVAEEIELLEGYLAIQRIRHPERIMWSVDLDRPCEGRQVPTLIVQPLIENAVSHGLRQNESAVLRITVRIECVQDGILISVINTRSSVARVRAGRSGGMGLKITRARLQMLFGDRAALDVSDDDPQLFTVRMRLPIAQAIAAISAIPASSKMPADSPARMDLLR